MPSETTNEQDLQVTRGSAWSGAQKQGMVTLLPSGNVVRIRRTMDLLHLLKSGRIPNPLKSIVQSMVDRGGSMPDMQDMDDNAIGAMLRLVDDVVLRSVTEPKILPLPQPGLDENGNRLANLAEGEEESDEDYQVRITAWANDDHGDDLPISFIDMDDRMYIFVVSQGFAADLATFRQEQAASMASLSDGAAVPPASEQPVGS